MDDHEIVDLYWQRDEHAIEATAAKYESYCMKISQNILSNRADSEENVNDTYLHAWKAMPPQRPAILSAFLGKIARNLALNRYKARSAQKRQGDAFALSLDELDDCAPALSSPDDEAMAAELGRSISASFSFRIVVPLSPQAAKDRTIAAASSSVKNRFMSDVPPFRDLLY